MGAAAAADAAASLPTTDDGNEQLGGGSEQHDTRPSSDGAPADALRGEHSDLGALAEVARKVVNLGPRARLVGRIA